MTLIHVLGRRGRGKTLRAVADAVREDVPVYSNFKINIPRWEPITPVKLYTLRKPSLIIIDEAYIWMDSRRSLLPLSTILSWILNQSRKRKMDIIVTNQLDRATDVRWREQADYNIYCKKVRQDDGRFAFKYIVEEQDDEKQVMRRQIQTLSADQAEKLYPIYDTDEIVEPLNPDVLDALVTDPRELMPKVDEVANAIMERAPKVKVTDAWVRNYCHRNGYGTKVFGALLYDTLKASGF